MVDIIKLHKTLAETDNLSDTEFRDAEYVEQRLFAHVPGLENPAQIVAAVQMIHDRGFVIDNMTESCGPGWWDQTPWRFLSRNGADIGEPQPTYEAAVADLAQYLPQLQIFSETII